MPVIKRTRNMGKKTQIFHIPEENVCKIVYDTYPIKDEIQKLGFKVWKNKYGTFEGYEKSNCSKSQLEELANKLKEEIDQYYEVKSLKEDAIYPGTYKEDKSFVIHYWTQIERLLDVDEGYKLKKGEEFVKE